MKYKLTLVIVTCILIVGGSIAETLYIKNTFESFEKMMEEQIGREEYSYEEVSEIVDWWAKRAEVLEVFISVLQLNEITVTLGELKGAVKKQDHDTAGALVDRIYEYAVRISDMYMFKLNNIL